MSKKMNYEESRFLADTGMLVIESWTDEIYLGISKTPSTRRKPEVYIPLTRRQAESLRAELAFWLEETKVAQDDV